mmetsp:Transcript_62045/g.74646  ORF Transcript_62045/g.74646 Transcript_62045/m.74646 type:complete len:175 (+) Transcript_62045:124-648(+)
MNMKNVCISRDLQILWEPNHTKKRTSAVRFSNPIESRQLLVLEESPIHRSDIPGVEKGTIHEIGMERCHYEKCSLQGILKNNHKIITNHPNKLVPNTINRGNDVTVNNQIMQNIELELSNSLIPPPQAAVSKSTTNRKMLWKKRSLVSRRGMKLKTWPIRSDTSNPAERQKQVS